MTTHGTPVATRITPKFEGDEAIDTNNKNLEVLGELPTSQRRKFIPVDDPSRGSRVRVRVMLDQAEMKEMPDSYRKTHCVYPQSFSPMQTSVPPPSSSSAFMGGRFPTDHDDESGAVSRGEVVQTMMTVPSMDGIEVEMEVPRMGRVKRRKGSHFDAHRDQMHGTMAFFGQDTEAIAPSFETRIDKKRWLARSISSESFGEQTFIATRGCERRER